MLVRPFGRRSIAMQRSCGASPRGKKTTRCAAVFENARTSMRQTGPPRRRHTSSCRALARSRSRIETAQTVVAAIQKILRIRVIRLRHLGYDQQTLHSKAVWFAGESPHNSSGRLCTRFAQLSRLLELYGQLIAWSITHAPICTVCKPVENHAGSIPTPRDGDP